MTIRTKLIHDWELPPTARAIGTLEHLAYERHRQDIKIGQTQDRRIFFDDVAAEVAFEFFRLLPLTKGKRWAGKPFELLPWEKFVIGNLWGWKRIATIDGKERAVRRYNTAYLQVAKKNGKTELVAGAGDLGLIGDGEPSAEVYSLAMTREQAKLAWGVAATMLVKSAELALLCRVRGIEPRQVSNIFYPTLGSKFEPLSREVGAQDGLNPSFLIVDEYHRFTSRDKVEMLVESMATRDEPIVIYTTTAGAGMTGPCYEEREYAEKVVSGIVDDDRYFAFVTEPDKRDRWDCEITWEKANPSIDVLIMREELTEKCEKAKAVPTKQNDFRRYRCNQWTEQIERAIDMDVWAECGDQFDLPALCGRPCFGGLDVASVLDIAAYVLLFPPVGRDPLWYLRSWFWTPYAGLRERGLKDRGQYQLWVDKGWLIADKTGNGETIRPESIESVVRETKAQYDIQEIAFDPWKARDIAQTLQDEGVTMVELAQVTTRLHIGTAFLLETLLPSRLLRHGNNPVLNWMASNLSVYKNTNNNMRPSRQSSGGKIDGIAAIVNAASRAAVVKVKPRRSRYAERGWQAVSLGKM